MDRCPACGGEVTSAGCLRCHTMPVYYGFCSRHGNWTSRSASVCPVCLEEQAKTLGGVPCSRCGGTGREP